MYKILIFLSCVTFITCYTTEDLELFDLVESTGQNFYRLLGVDEKASSSEIKKAYRRLSTQLHPDRNKNANAEEEFRTVAAVADVLRNDERRKQYDVILKMGLPDWRSPIYYYRKVRKMGLFELAVFLFCLTTFFQYIYNWVSYWERKYTIEEILLTRKKKKPKNSRKATLNAAKIEEEELIQEVTSRIPKPKCSDLFPVHLAYFVFHLIKSSPYFVVSCIQYLRRPPQPIVEEEDEEEEPAPRIRYRKPVVKPKYPEYAEVSIDNNNTTDEFPELPSIQQEIKTPQTETKRWVLTSLNDAQITEFKKALKKFPVGTLQRWEKIAFNLGCPISDVLTMVKQLKSPKLSKALQISGQGVTGTENENAGSELFTEKGSVQEAADPTNGAPLWRQEEQKTLEQALQKFPKDTAQRWDKIAAFVGTKTKDECVERYKLLAEQVKKKKDKGV